MWGATPVLGLAASADVLAGLAAPVNVLAGLAVAAGVAEEPSAVARVRVAVAAARISKPAVIVTGMKKSSELTPVIIPDSISGWPDTL